MDCCNKQLLTGLPWAQVARFLGVDAPGPAPRQPKVARAPAGATAPGAWPTPGILTAHVASRDSVRMQGSECAPVGSGA